MRKGLILRRYAFLLVAVAVCLAGLLLYRQIGAVAAGVTGWREELGTWRYYTNGELVKRAWIDKDGGKAYVDYNGAALNGWHWMNAVYGVTEQAERYYAYFDEKTGKALTGFQVIDGYPYTFDNEGRLLSEPLTLWNSDGSGNVRPHRDLIDVETGWYKIGWYTKHQEKAQTNINIEGERFYIEKIGHYQYKIYTEDRTKAFSSNLRAERVADNDSQTWYIVRNDSDSSISFVSKSNGFVLTGSDTFSLTAPTYQANQRYFLSETSANGNAADTSAYTHDSAKRKTAGERNSDDYSLVKVGNKYQLITKDTNEVVSSGDGVYIGTFFGSDADASQHRLLTLNGTDFYDIPNTWSSAIRDSSLFARNGTFNYIHYGGTANGTFWVSRTNDFDNYQRLNPKLNALSSYTPIWAPEWFEDDNGDVYAFYSTQIATTTQLNETINRELADKRVFGIAYAKLDSVSDMTFGEAKLAQFDKKPGDDGLPGYGNLIDAQVIKHGSEYVMVVKNDAAAISSEKDSILIYKTDNLDEVWRYQGTVDCFPAWSEDYSAYEAPNIQYINGKYYLYVDHYIDRVYGQRTYDGEIYYATSTDLENWTFEGNINVDNESLRHGSVNRITDEAAIRRIMELFGATETETDEQALSDGGDNGDNSSLNDGSEVDHETNDFETNRVPENAKSAKGVEAQYVKTIENPRTATDSLPIILVVPAALLGFIVTGCCLFGRRR
ncbi:hypothetical protein IKF15_02355 [Candidatus Saccharibacteria bacterium]|nr:hypothetical protein [Candidatus Saccharibacteria bacterium]